MKGTTIDPRVRAQVLRETAEDFRRRGDVITESRLKDMAAREEGRAAFLETNARAATPMLRAVNE